MDVVSYRGPGVAGGVSSGLSGAWRKYAHPNSRWWFLNGGIFEVLSSGETQGRFISLMSDSLLKGHYGFCNSFLWPLMHDLPQYASYSAEQHEQYKTFNRLISEQIDVEADGRKEYFIQDYQLAIVPRWLSLFGHKTKIFWHIPWPAQVPPEFVEPLCEVAVGLLGASLLGFHTKEFARNFADFVKTHLPEYSVDQQNLVVCSNEGMSSRLLQSYVRPSHKSYIMHQNSPPRNRSGNSTVLLAHPLGIDMDFWEDEARSAHLVDPDERLSELAKGDFVLSVDRVDYTKSVLERLFIIDRFFQMRPQFIGRLSFIQVCARSRPGVSVFDQYWSSCRTVAGAINRKWQRGEWQPIEWIDRPLNSKELAYLYARAQIMLVNPVRDGLNLIAKEFIACQGNNPGMLVLSSGAGASHELGHYTLSAFPDDPGRTVDSLLHSLTMPAAERRWRVEQMKLVLRANQLSNWWQAFSAAAAVGEISEPELDAGERSA